MGPPQPDYINACAILEVQLEPHTIWENRSATALKFSRVRRERWGPRTIDLDLLLFDDLISKSPTLELPHRRMRERAFVLVPLAEIARHWIDPVTEKARAQLLENIDPTGVKKLTKELREIT